jgi:hypothetical protein
VCTFLTPANDSSDAAITSSMFIVHLHRPVGIRGGTPAAFRMSGTSKPADERERRYRCPGGAMSGIRCTSCPSPSSPTSAITSSTGGRTRTKTRSESAVGRRLRESGSHRLGWAGVPVTLRAQGPYSVGRKAVQLEVAAPRRQPAAESEFSRLSKVESRPALSFASTHDEGQVVTMTSLADGRVQERPGFAIRTNALQRDDSPIDPANSLPRTQWALPIRPDLPLPALHGSGRQRLPSSATTSGCYVSAASRPEPRSMQWRSAGRYRASSAHCRPTSPA